VISRGLWGGGGVNLKEQKAEGGPSSDKCGQLLVERSDDWRKTELKRKRSPLRGGQWKGSGSERSAVAST